MILINYQPICLLIVKTIFIHHSVNGPSNRIDLKQNLFLQCINKITFNCLCLYSYKCLCNLKCRTYKCRLAYVSSEMRVVQRLSSQTLQLACRVQIQMRPLRLLSYKYVFQSCKYTSSSSNLGLVSRAVRSLVGNHWSWMLC